ncbi:MAG: nucleoside monophosphate kinase [Parcubacteria group bacterium]|jgi:adenylate kinase
MNIIVLGPQGSGKGTQAELLAKKYNLEHIDMGKYLRVVAKLDTPLGKEIWQIQNVTKTLVPSRIMREVLHLKLNELPREQGIVFDGVPRNQEQMDYLESALQETGRKIDAVILINISEEESVRRICRRWTCKNGHPLIMGVDVQSEKDKCPIDGSDIFQRADDTPEGVKKRLKVYHEETTPVIGYYKNKNLLIEIDGQQSVEEVFAEVVDLLENRIRD